MIASQCGDFIPVGLREVPIFVKRVGYCRSIVDAAYLLLQLGDGLGWHALVQSIGAIFYHVSNFKSQDHVQIL